MIVFLLFKTLSIKFVVELRANFIINFKTFKPMKTKLRKINLEALSKKHMLFLRGGDGTGGNGGTINTGTSCSTIDNVNICSTVNHNVNCFSLNNNGNCSALNMDQSCGAVNNQSPSCTAVNTNGKCDVTALY